MPGIFSCFLRSRLRPSSSPVASRCDARIATRSFDSDVSIGESGVARCRTTVRHEHDRPTATGASTRPCYGRAAGLVDAPSRGLVGAKAQNTPIFHLPRRYGRPSKGPGGATNVARRRGRNRDDRSRTEAAPARRSDAHECHGILGIPNTDVPLPGTKMRLRDTSGPPAGAPLRPCAMATNPCRFRPQDHGAMASIGRVRAGEVTVLDLPASGWSGRTSGRRDFEFKSRSGAVVSARLVGGRSIRISARGDGAYPLDGTPQSCVGIIIDVGAYDFCGFLGGTSVKDDGERLVRGRLPPPRAAPSWGRRLRRRPPRRRPPAARPPPPTRSNVSSHAPITRLHVGPPWPPPVQTDASSHVTMHVRGAAAAKL